MVFGLHNEREDLPASINELMVSIGQKPCTQDCVRLRTILKAVIRSSGSLQLKGTSKTYTLVLIEHVKNKVHMNNL